MAKPPQNSDCRNSTFCQYSSLLCLMYTYTYHAALCWLAMKMCLLIICQFSMALSALAGQICLPRHVVSFCSAARRCCCTFRRDEQASIMVPTSYPIRVALHHSLCRPFQNFAVSRVQSLYLSPSGKARHWPLPPARRDSCIFGKQTWMRKWALLGIRGIRQTLATLVLAGGLSPFIENERQTNILSIVHVRVYCISSVVVNEPQQASAGQYAVLRHIGVFFMIHFSSLCPESSAFLFAAAISFLDIEELFQQQVGFWRI